MLTWVALLKGVNVGGHNRVPMADLRAAAEALGWCDVRTHLASGNLLFRADGDAGGLEQAVQALLPVTVPVFVMQAHALRDDVAACPFAPAEGKLCHGYFSRGEVALDQALLDELTEDEQVSVQGHVVWLHTPSGFSQSKVADKWARVTRGGEMTARNLNTLRKLVDMSAPAG